MPGSKSAHLSADMLIGIGDLHGHYPALKILLDSLDRKYSIFEDRDSLTLQTNKELVFTGDYIDRGSQSRKVIETLMKLKQNNPTNARELFGNHELLALADLDFARNLSARNSPIAYYRTSIHGMNGGDEFVLEFGENALKDYSEALDPKSPIGAWMRSLEDFRHVRIHDRSVLLVHAGIPVEIRDREDLGDYHERFLQNMSTDTSVFGGTAVKYGSKLTSGHTIFWDRRIPKTDDPSNVDAILEDLEIDYLVIGHTPQRQVTKYGKGVFNIDVGMTPAYGANEPAAIIFKPNGVFSFYVSGREELLARYQ